MISALPPAAAIFLAQGTGGESRSLFRDLFGAGSGWGSFASAVLGFAVVFAVASALPVLFTWAERRVSGRMQQRRGPNRVGPFGLVQAVADGVKLMFKEDIIPANAERFLFALAPGLVLAGMIAAFALIPFSERAIVVDAPLGVYLLAALLSLQVLGVVMAGWASNNKWSLLGAMREAAQMVSYEIPMGICLLIGVLSFSTLSLREMSLAQADGWLNVGNWLIFRNPLFAFPAFVVLYVALLANTKRAPFDLPEAESELVSGFHTEYSGIRFSFFFLEEYASMFLVSALAVCMFLGGWNIPFLPGSVVTGSVGAEILAALVLIVKSFALVFVMIWLRWTLPRIRIDQVMNLCYKYLTPIAFVCLIGTCWWELR